MSHKHHRNVRWTTRTVYFYSAQKQLRFAALWSSFAPPFSFQRDREPNDEQVQVSELEQMVGRLTMENALLKKALARLEEQQLPSAASSKTR